MQILRSRKELDRLLEEIREKNLEIGLIPTMGSIHEGHLSLVKKSIHQRIFSLATIYINPTQFNNKEDYRSYPREEQKDIEKIDYLEIRNEENLSFSDTCNKSRIFIAIYIGQVRVIDNFILY